MSRSTSEDVRASAATPTPPPSPTPRPTSRRRRGSTSCARPLREFSNDQCTDLAAALTYYARAGALPGDHRAGLAGRAWSGEGTDASTHLLDIVRQVGAGSRGEDTCRAALTAAERQPQAAGLALVIGLARRAVVGVRLRRRVRPRDEPDLRDRRGPAVLEAAPGACCWSPWSRSCWRRRRSSALVVTGPLARPSATRSALGSTRRSPSGTSPSGRCSLVVVVARSSRSSTTRRPNVKQPKFRWISVGAGRRHRASGSSPRPLFGFYVAQLPLLQQDLRLARRRRSSFLLWLWITNLALLFGAELDAELERGRQLQAGHRGRGDLQLPPRDTRNIEKADEKEPRTSRAAASCGRPPAAATTSTPTRRSSGADEGADARR